MAATPNPNQALKDAVKKVGSQSALARLLRVSQAAVWRWLTEEKPLPAEYVLTVEAETGIAKERLRPDIYPPDAAAPPAPDPVFASIEPAR